MNRKSKKLISLGVAAAVLGIAVLLLSLYTTDSCQLDTFSMGSYVQQTVYGKNKKEAAQQASGKVTQLEQLISWKIEGSDIQRLNAAAGGEFVKIDPAVYQLLRLSADVSEVSHGAFDITIAPISQLWDFDAQQELVPDSKLIESLLPEVGFEAVKLGEDNTAALYGKGNAVELGAIGKGAACDTMLQSYKDFGVSGAIASVGGSVGIYGSKPLGFPWRVAVRDPKSTGGMGELSLKEGFLSTSGNYEKGFEKDGVWYHHILDPKTGYPAGYPSGSDLQSVTVWTKSSGALSDALSTVCYIMGLDESLGILETYDAQAVFVTKDDKVIVTNGLRSNFKLISEGYSMEELPIN